MSHSPLLFQGHHISSNAHRCLTQRQKACRRPLNEFPTWTNPWQLAFGSSWQCRGPEIIRSMTLVLILRSLIVFGLYQVISISTASWSFDWEMNAYKGFTDLMTFLLTVFRAQDSEVTGLQRICDGSDSISLVRFVAMSDGVVAASLLSPRWFGIYVYTVHLGGVYSGLGPPES
jgi:hypothetical protein